MKKINVNDVEVSVSQQAGREDYICLTDMAHYKDADRTNYIIQNWMRLRGTIEFLGLWEQINNPNFKGIEFDAFRNNAGANSFTLTPKQWIEKTGAIGIVSTPGRYGGTYAHKDIAFEFGTWLSPAFKLYLIKEYQRLKEIESHPSLGEWNVKRILSKVNYTIHTDAVRDFVIPTLNESEKLYAYSTEADMLNLALWGCTAKQWREANPKYAEQGLNIRDMASINELVVLANLESMNSELNKQGLDKIARYAQLRNMAQEQLKRLNLKETDKNFRAIELRDKKLMK
ncbi:KilA-N domain-containing protein [uncultured Alistipes sp.]|uniref:KilA-N domain-containing protein n=1 Tax=uncultured Alistipes sp. TaxID=538949 RepID=UPI00209AD420|nr:KilA-N domain-containing protein [Alistipes sp. CHKCI003]